MGTDDYARARAQKLKEFYAMAGMVLLSRLQFTEAVAMLSISGIDPREIISVYPQYTPPSQRAAYQPSHSYDMHQLGTSCSRPSLASSNLLSHSLTWV